MSVYYANSANCTAHNVAGWAGGTGGFNGSGGATELSDGYKDNISADDGNRATLGTNNACRWQVHPAENPADVTQIDLIGKLLSAWAGGDCLFLWVWDFAANGGAGGAEQLDTICDACPTGICSLSATITENLSNYFDGSGDFYYYVDTESAATMNRTYFGSCTITTNGGGSAVPVIMRAYRNRRES